MTEQDHTMNSMLRTNINVAEKKRFPLIVIVLMLHQKLAKYQDQLFYSLADWLNT